MQLTVRRAHVAACECVSARRWLRLVQLRCVGSNGPGDQFNPTHRGTDRTGSELSPGRKRHVLGTVFGAGSPKRGRDVGMAEDGRTNRLRNIGTVARNRIWGRRNDIAGLPSTKGQATELDYLFAQPIILAGIVIL